MSNCNDSLTNPVSITVAPQRVDLEIEIARGIAGPAGPVGPTGATGPAGPQGQDGPQGIQGLQGLQGLQGIRGERGEVGPQGQQGLQGLQGLQGDKGEKGDSGLQGIAATIDIAGTATGVPGSDAAVTNLGTPQAASLFFDIPRGEVGQMGPEGPMGPAGPQGISGEVGPQGERGPAGPEGPMGPAGPEGERGPAGPEGPMGPTGPTGPQGATGSQGPAGDTYATTSNTTNVLENGTKTWVVNDLGVDYSVGQPVIVAYDLDHHAHGTVVSYSHITGELVVSVDKHTGNGTWSSWSINLEGVAGVEGPMGPTGPMGPVGQTGPAGPEGSMGPVGDTGPMGPEGPQGTVFNSYKGGWYGPTEYYDGDIVTYQGATWMLVDKGSWILGYPPPSNGWALLADVGATGMMGPEGPTGPQGEIGLTGPMGPTGPAGANGIDGSTINWRGDWSATFYNIGDGVYYDGSSYRAIDYSNNQTPYPGSPYWALLAIKGSKGDKGDMGATGATGATGANGADGTSFVWRGAYTPGIYSANDVVELDGSSYIATAYTDSTSPPNTPWQLMSSKGANGADGAQGPEGPQGPTGPAGETPSVSGTGLWHSVSGTLQSAASLVVNADVSASAAIEQSKIANLTTDLSGKALKTTSITAGTGLTGGGDLSADRTISVSFGSTSTTSCVGNDSRLSDSRTPTGAAGGALTGTYPNPGIATVPIASGGTGSTTASAARTALGLGNVENTALSTWAGSSSLTTLGTIATGTWNGTAIAIANGGTGSTTASAARTALGLAIGTDVQAYNANTTLLGNSTTGTGSIVRQTSPTILTSLNVQYGASANGVVNVNSLGNISYYTAASAIKWQIIADYASTAVIRLSNPATIGFFDGADLSTASAASGLWREENGLAVRLGGALGAGTVAQIFRVYNTWSGTTSYERAKLAWETNVLAIGTEKGSAGGTARGLSIQTDGTDRITVGAAGGVSISGTTTVNAFATGVQAVSASGTCNGAAVVIADATSGSIALTLPSPVSGQTITVKKICPSSNTVTISPPSGTIDGQANVVLSTQYQSVTIVCDGTNYFLV